MPSSLPHLVMPARKVALRSPQRVAARLAACLLTGAVGVTAVAGTAAGEPLKPPTPEFDTPVEDYTRYPGQAEDDCDPVAKPGTLALQDLLTTTYGNVWSNIVRSCTGTGTSSHHAGRALDWHGDASDTAEFEQVSSIIEWMMEPDADGNSHAVARRLGVYYLIYNNKWFRMYNPEAGWVDYNNCSTDPDKLAPSYDTYCHRDHLHVSLTWEGARAETSFYQAGSTPQPTGTPTPTADPEPSPSPEPSPEPSPTTVQPCESDVDEASLAPAPQVSEGLGFVATDPVRILDTRDGDSDGIRCRMTPGTPLPVDITSAGIEPGQAAAVALNVTATNTAGDAWVRVRPAGPIDPQASPTAALHVNGGQTMGSLVVVPVGAGDLVTLEAGVSELDLVVDVMGYFPADGSGDAFNTMMPTRALDDSVEAGAWQALNLPVPGDATAVLGNLVGDEPVSTAFMSLHPKPAGTPTTSVVNPAAGRATANRVMVATDSSKVLLYANQRVRGVLDVAGYFSAGGDLGFYPRVPTRVVDTRTGLGGVSRLQADELRVIDMRAVAGLDTRAKAVVASMAMVGHDHDTWLSAWPAGANWPGTSDVNAVRGAPQVNLVVVPLSDDGALQLALGHGTSDLVIDVLGYFAAAS